VNDNLNFGLEVMLREIMGGKNYTAGVGTNSLSFRNGKNESVEYKLDNNTIKRSGDGGSTFLQLTSSEITIDKLIFKVKNTSSPSMVTIILSGYMAEKEKTKSQMHIQTTVSQRNI
jgi:hypothetical protein